MTKFVDVESPYSGKTEEEIRRNLLYGRACIRDCLFRGEIPFASHLFFTQPGILDDNISKEREMGINAGKELARALWAIAVVYQDLGTSKGMQEGIRTAEKEGRSVEYRTLGNGWEQRELEVARKHSHAKLWGFGGV